MDLALGPLICNLYVFQNGYLTVEIEEENNMWRDVSSVSLCLEIPLKYLKADSKIRKQVVVQAYI